MGGQPACFLNESMVEKDSDSVYIHQHLYLVVLAGPPPGLGTAPGDQVRACELHACHHAREFYCSIESRREVCRNVRASLRASQFHSRALSSVVPKAGLQNGASL